MTACQEEEGERGPHIADDADPAALAAAAAAHRALAARLTDLVHELRALEADVPSAGFAAAVGARADAERRRAAATCSFTILQARAGRAARRQQQRKAATAPADDAPTQPTPRGEEEDEPLRVSRVEAAASDGFVSIGVDIDAGGDGYEAETTCWGGITGGAVATTEDVLTRRGEPASPPAPDDASPTGRTYDDITKTPPPHLRCVVSPLSSPSPVLRCTVASLPRFLSGLRRVQAVLFARLSLGCFVLDV